MLVLEMWNVVTRTWQQLATAETVASDDPDREKRDVAGLLKDLESGYDDDHDYRVVKVLATWPEERKP